jgi:hypothetical protein
MKDKHRKALKELSQWCKKYDCYISLNNNRDMLVVTFREIGQMKFGSFPSESIEMYIIDECIQARVIEIIKAEGEE